MKKPVLCIVTVYIDGTTETKQVYHDSAGAAPAGPGSPAPAGDSDIETPPTKPGNP